MIVIPYLQDQNILICGSSNVLIMNKISINVFNSLTDNLRHVPLLSMIVLFVDITIISKISSLIYCLKKSLGVSSFYLGWWRGCSIGIKLPVHPSFSECAGVLVVQLTLELGFIILAIWRPHHPRYRGLGNFKINDEIDISGSKALI